MCSLIISEYKDRYCNIYLYKLIVSFIIATTQMDPFISKWVEIVTSTRNQIYSCRMITSAEKATKTFGRHIVMYSIILSRYVMTRAFLTYDSELIWFREIWQNFRNENSKYKVLCNRNKENLLSVFSVKNNNLLFLCVR